MDQLKRLFGNLSLKQQISLGAVALTVIIGLISFSRWNKERDFKPLYTNLAPEDAGQVVARMKETGVEYRLAENGSSILVPSSRIAELRLTLASAGLPKSGRMGFEMFDRTNFGASDFTEQVNYHRALEGELERSIMSIGEVERARVHLTFAKESLYTESRQPAKASVLLTLRTGTKLSQQNVAAICHLTASAVEGLQPEAVSVLDMRGNLLNRARKADGTDGEPSEALLEYRQRLERELTTKIANTLEPLVGPDRYRAGVFVDCDFTSGEQSEETYDPSKSVMLNSQRTEDGGSAAAASGVPGTASNLPRPTSRPSSGSGNNFRRTENVTYASSRLVKHVKLPQGTIRRVSVSVLLDHTLRFENGRKIIEPPSPEKLKVVKDLIAGVAGIVPERGDQIIVESSPFETTLSAEPPPSATPAAPVKSPPAAGPAWLQQLMANKSFPILAGIAGAIILLLGGGTVFMISRQRKKKRAVTVSAQTALEAATEKSAVPGAPNRPAIESETEDVKGIQARQELEVLRSINLPAPTTKKTEVLIKQIQTEAKKDPVMVAQVVRSWLNATD